MKDITHIISEKIEPIRKDFGVFFTPQWVIDFMVDLIDETSLSDRSLSLLEPACGVCQFIRGIRDKRPQLYNRFTLRVGVEINSDIVDYLRNNKLFPDITLVNEDYLLWETDERFDVIIGNPPYGIPSLSEHYTIRVDNATKDKYKRLYETWYGKYNVYGAFIEKSGKTVKEWRTVNIHSTSYVYDTR
ncbi:MAG: N-6 DNA methylase [Aquificota bacterium]|nr:N-6 DNA methylase [Aquificota bacterium]